MQIDMHFYATYALARAAGLPPDIAQTVANAAQFVDEAIDEAPLLRNDAAYHVPVASCHELHDKKNLKPIDQWHVWLPYHFLPGNLGCNWEERLVCRKGDSGNIAANAIIDLALEHIEMPFAPHLLGVVTHVLQDTFSHAGFLGISSRYNCVIQDSLDIGSITDPELLAEKTSMLNEIVELLNAPGHAAVASLPDYPYLSWSFDYQYGNEECPRRHGAKTVKRDNTLEFANCCERVYEVFRQAAARGPSQWKSKQPQREYQDIQPVIKRILSLEAKRDGRGKAWMQALRAETFCDVEADDNHISYDPLGWKLETHAGREFRPGSDPVLFMRASHIYRSFVHSALLPELLPEE